MIKILLRIVGLLVVVGAVAAVWYGFEKADQARGLEQSIYAQRSLNVRRSGEAKEAGLKKITEFEQGIEAKKTERTIWFGVAAVAFFAGLGLAMLPSSRKRKASVTEPSPAQSQDAPSA